MEKILECEYIDNNRRWEIQKKELLERYSKKYNNIKIAVKRVKSDTKGLRCYIVYEI